MICHSVKSPDVTSARQITASRLSSSSRRLEIRTCCVSAHEDLSSSCDDLLGIDHVVRKRRCVAVPRVEVCAPSINRDLVEDLKPMIARHKRTEMLDVAVIDCVDEAHNACNWRLAAFAHAQTASSVASW